MTSSVAETQPGATKVLTFPKPGAFGSASYPAGVPTALDPSPIVIDSAADAIAVLAGCEWDALTPSRRDEFRQWAILAATAAHPDGIRLLAYSLQNQDEPAFTDAAPVVRRSMVDSMIGALRLTAARVAGNSNPQNHANLVALMRQDLPGKGQW